MGYQFEFQLREDYKRYALINEGDANHFYLDTNGHVTVGIGHLVPDEQNAATLTMYDKSGNKADIFDLENEYQLIKSQNFGQQYGKDYYSQFAHLYMHDADINHLYHQDFVYAYTALTNHFPAFDTYPETAQLAMLDLAFNMNVLKMSTHFPNLIKAIKQKDWKTAAKESHRKKIQESRNILVKNWFLEATKEQPERKLKA